MRHKTRKNTISKTSTTKTRLLSNSFISGFQKKELVVSNLNKNSNPKNITENITKKITKILPKHNNNNLHSTNLQSIIDSYKIDNNALSSLGSLGSLKPLDFKTTKGSLKTRRTLQKYSQKIEKPKKSKQRFFTISKTAYRLKRPPVVDDPILEFFDDYSYNIMARKMITSKIIGQNLFKHNDNDCICENILNKKISQKCNCYDINFIKNDNKTGSRINSIICQKSVNTNEDNLKIDHLEGDNQEEEEKEYILTADKLNNYYIQKNYESSNMIFIETDSFTLNSIINYYLNKELPLNTINIKRSGVCKYIGYNLLDYADLGSGINFINDILDHKYDEEFEIHSKDKRYQLVINYLLQIIFTIGHLQTSKLEFFHGNCSSKNFLVKRLSKNTYPSFTFVVSNRLINIENLGFAVQITNFSKSSITLYSSKYHKPIRVVPAIRYKSLLNNYVKEIIDKDAKLNSKIKQNPEVTNRAASFDKIFLSKLLPSNKDPMIDIIRSSGGLIYRDCDLYTFFIGLVNSEKILKYVEDNSLFTTILSFMSDDFINEFSNHITKNKQQSINESLSIAIKIFNKIKEPMNKIFTNNYFKSLELLNLYLMDPK
jgi:hypothetical protein